ncbi:hypothetical protein [Serratia symbiotica]|uniref:hypothetical protein n=1 Tax=Serratia symbiotica TaxID=138074 RepID=UPI0013281DC5|nr:hypothetical protein [Serratia symbiotica]QTP14870.1 hypothetical protein GPZ83_0002340 [Serratia symbiotica]
MNIVVDHKKQFLSIFNETARYHHRHKVFRDFITLASVSIHNNILFDEKLEQEYMETVRQYEAEDTERMVRLLAEVVMGLEAESCDFLGSLYMSLELGESARGQFFTPYGPMLTVMSNKDSLNHNVILIFIYNSSDTEYNAMAKCIRSVLTGTTMQCRLGCLNTLIVSWDII